MGSEWECNRTKELYEEAKAKYNATLERRTLFENKLNDLESKERDLESRRSDIVASLRECESHIQETREATHTTKARHSEESVNLENYKTEMTDYHNKIPEACNY